MRKRRVGLVLGLVGMGLMTGCDGCKKQDVPVTEQHAAPQGEPARLAVRSL